jgi:hypothetical protein
MWQFEMQVHHTNVEMYRDTTDRRNIQKKMGAMPEKNGHGDQPFTQNKTKTEKGKDNSRTRDLQ